MGHGKDEMEGPGMNQQVEKSWEERQRSEKARKSSEELERAG